MADFRKFVTAAGYQTDAEKGNGAYVWDGSEWGYKKDANWKNPYFSQGENHPVVCVSWNDAVAYCNWRSRQEGLTPVYSISGSSVSYDLSANGYRLPTEAEWEYAARGGSREYKYSWGNGAPQGRQGGNVADEAAKRKFSGWTIFEGYDDGFVYTAPVGEFDPNVFGVYDMTGNAWEWCNDWYGSDYYQSSPRQNPPGPASGSSRVLRGGSWLCNPSYARAAYRDSGRPPYASSTAGFRLARTR